MKITLKKRSCLISPSINKLKVMITVEVLNVCITPKLGENVWKEHVFHSVPPPFKFKTGLHELSSVAKTIKSSFSTN
ncbi:hypothetical protein M5K25_013869 [Dendrobium thyrsiflorum]|uniref:Uncharacterized protein n=1 Tax=Dendrobium thyrsiflorum TaxID=117978 RepID=A0ABD0UUW7_DENTH